MNTSYLFRGRVFIRRQLVGSYTIHAVGVAVFVIAALVVSFFTSDQRLVISIATVVSVPFVIWALSGFLASEDTRYAALVYNRQTRRLRERGILHLAISEKLIAIADILNVPIDDLREQRLRLEQAVASLEKTSLVFDPRRIPRKNVTPLLVGVLRIERQLKAIESSSTMTPETLDRLNLLLANLHSGEVSLAEANRQFGEFRQGALTSSSLSDQVAIDRSMVRLVRQLTT